MKPLIYFLFLFSIFGCGGNKAKYIAPREDDIVLENFSKYEMQMPAQTPLMSGGPLLSASPNQNTANEIITAPFIIHNPLSSALTVWALAAGNWVWGYTLEHSKTFGEARIWHTVELGNNIIMLVNQLTKTCLNDHGSGVTHEKCNRNAKTQHWGLLPMDNGAFSLMSMSSRKCITTENGSIIDMERYYSITMTTCKSAANYDQQWRFLPPTYYATPLYD